MINNTVANAVGFVPDFVISSIAGLFSVIGVLANILTIIAFIRHQSLFKNATTLFIINLCVIDLIFSSINLPMMTVFYHYKYWIFGQVLCKIYPILYTLNYSAGWLTISIVIINRYFLICKPEIYGNIYTSLNVKIMLALVWIIPLFQAFLALVEVLGKLDQDPDTLICTISENNAIDAKKTHLVVGFIIPSVVIVITFFLIYKKVNFKNQNTTELSDNDTESIQTNLAIVKIMLTIFICLLICYLPLPLLMILDDNYQKSNLRIICEIFFWAHVFTNPIIFFFTGKLYRESYRQIMFSFGKRHTSVK
ncbi:hypothetical protein HCN44_002365 [Aphidius gifuensis]|uniref:G-protein coupled receptors family 1 profile domain-containing protein n=1 Tax=Aphidius gifuensis TaxID=684658 RepID=A0A835CU63_APHGI|nr:hypothetical protein HCN44_002365 [Aphidius gifuensis]